MLSAAKVTEIYCMTDDFAGNLCCTGKNIWLGIKYCNMFKLYVSCLLYTSDAADE